MVRLSRNWFLLLGEFEHSITFLCLGVMFLLVGGLLVTLTENETNCIIPVIIGIVFLLIWFFVITLFQEMRQSSLS